MVKKTCTWTYIDDPDYDSWETSCDEAFQFLAGSPQENRFFYCPYCGAEIKEKKEKI